MPFDYDTPERRDSELCDLATHEKDPSKRKAIYEEMLRLIAQIERTDKKALRTNAASVRSRSV